MSLLFFPQMCRLALVGRVFREALSANLSGSGGGVEYNYGIFLVVLW